MTAINGVFKTVFSLLSPHAMSAASPLITCCPSCDDLEPRLVKRMAQFSMDEYEKQAQRRSSYARLAEQQGISEVESHAEAYWRSGE